MCWPLLTDPTGLPVAIPHIKQTQKPREHLRLPRRALTSSRHWCTRCQVNGRWTGSPRRGWRFPLCPKHLFLHPAHGVASCCGLFPTARITLCKKLRKGISAVWELCWGAKLQRARLAQFLFEEWVWEVAQGPWEAQPGLPQTPSPSKLPRTRLQPSHPWCAHKRVSKWVTFRWKSSFVHLTGDLSTERLIRYTDFFLVLMEGEKCRMENILILTSHQPLGNSL